MSEPTVKIIDVGQVTTTKAGDAELTYKVEVVHEGVTYQRTIKLVSHAEIIHHIGAPVTPEDVERLALMRLDEVQSLHAAAKHHKDRVGKDMVAALKAKRVEPLA